MSDGLDKFKESKAMTEKTKWLFYKVFRLYIDENAPPKHLMKSAKDVDTQTDNILETTTKGCG